ncbi:hypothetical protein TH53_00045 [Pedobacter lusitanus]|uniref:Arylamine N-acetyltransferase n=2 Tax=Pedobacter lusitanus TaxID=1503925 RepID=A0A0D0FB31_9SPHI|nr:hypothetical protein TH53_00045 [Pedobacter lusitanus]
MQTQEYLSRINYQEKAIADLASLQGLMKAHLLNVPFENLDIHQKVWIALDEEKIYTKIVHQRRGGFCYELNGVFRQLLIQIGFDVQLIGAKVFQSATQTFSPPTDHMALLVRTAGETYLADVGFGDFISVPIRISALTHHEEACGRFRLTQTDEYYYVVEKYDEKTAVYIPCYTFTTAPLLLNDFTHSCYYHQLSPDSNFTKNKVCSVLTETGRKTITQAKFMVTTDGVKTEQPVPDEAAFSLWLAKEFAISL